MRRLQHHADARLDAVQREVAVVVPADAQDARLRLVEPADQVHDGGLAAAGRPDQRDRLPALDVQAEVGQHRLVGLVVEVHVVELDVAADGARIERAVLIGDVGLGVHQREDALGRGDGVLQLRVDARQVLDRPQHEGDVAEERRDRADRHPADPGAQPGVEHDRAHRERADELHRRQEQRRQPGRPVRRAVHLVRQPGEVGQVGVLAAQRLHHPHAGDVLVVLAGDLGVDLAHHAELHQDAFLELDRHHRTGSG